MNSKWKLMSAVAFGVTMSVPVSAMTLNDPAASSLKTNTEVSVEQVYGRAGHQAHGTNAEVATSASSSAGSPFANFFGDVKDTVVGIKDKTFEMLNKPSAQAEPERYGRAGGFVADGRIERVEQLAESSVGEDVKVTMTPPVEERFGRASGPLISEGQS